MSQWNSRPIALVGLMGAGKSAVAAALGERLGSAVADLDRMIEAEEGARVSELFARAGEAWFRRRESELLEQVLGLGVRVVATGGGVVLDPIRRDALRRHCLVAWLQVSPEAALARLRAEGGEPGDSRPLLAGPDPGGRLAQLLAEREPLYAAIAHVRVSTDGRSVAEVADAVLTAREGLA